jgi:hypothetical protein
LVAVDVAALIVGLVTWLTALLLFLLLPLFVLPLLSLLSLTMRALTLAGLSLVSFVTHVAFSFAHQI